MTPKELSVTEVLEEESVISEEESEYSEDCDSASSCVCEPPTPVEEENQYE